MAWVSDHQHMGRVSGSEGSCPTSGDSPQSPETIYKPECRIELETAPWTSESSICVEIIDQRAVGWDRRSQVVVARLVRSYLRGGDASTLAPGSLIVAKFYDPRFAFAPQEWVGGSTEMCNYSKEKETRAYKMLTDLQGSGVPVYYGEYTCPPPSDSLSQARISALLFEFVEDPDLFRQHHLPHSADELEALKTAAYLMLERIHACHVYQYDILPGNILWGRETGRLTLVDFDRAAFEDTGRYRDMPNADQYLARHDTAMMGLALEVVGIMGLSVSFPVSSF